MRMAVQTPMTATVLSRLAGSLVALAGAAAHGALPEAGYTYAIVAKHSQKVLDVRADKPQPAVPGPLALDDQRPVQQLDDLGPARTNQRFRLIREDDGTYTIRPQHSGKCLAVRGDDKKNLAIVEQYACNGKGGQKWQLEELGGADAGYVKITSVLSGKVMDIRGGPGAKDNSLPLQLFDWLGANNDNQKFGFVKKSKTVVCTAPTDDGFVSQGEGFERVGIVPGKVQDVVQNGGRIQDCLGRVASGDNLVIVAHGNKGFFAWGDDQYTGFGAGQGQDPAPIPAGFGNLQDVNARIVSCLSAARPDQGSSLVEGLFAAMGGARRGHRVSGFSGLAATGLVKGLMGGTVAQQTAATAALDAGNAPWLNNPPVNRPGAVTNHLTEAQKVVDAAVGRAVVTVVIPEARGRGAAPVIGGYTEGTADVGKTAAVDAADRGCGGIDSITVVMAQDVSDRVSVGRSGFRYDRRTGRFVQTISARNISPGAITGPLSVALDDLSENASLTGAAGVTSLTLPSGSPFVNFDLGAGNVLGPGKTATVVLRFDDATMTGITYNTRVLAGTGER